MPFNHAQSPSYCAKKKTQVISPTAVLVLVLAPPRSLRRTSWNPGGSLVEPWWNLTSGPPRTTPEPIWAETPKLSAVGENTHHLRGLVEGWTLGAYLLPRLYLLVLKYTFPKKEQAEGEKVNFHLVETPGKKYMSSSDRFPLKLAGEKNKNSP